MSKKVVTGLVRFSYLHVFKPYAYREGDTEKYSVALLIPKSDTKTVRKIHAAVDAVIEEGVQTKWGGKKPKDLSLPLHDGDEEQPEAPEYAGMYYLNAKTSADHAPGVFDKDREAILDPSEVKSGDWGRASVSFYPFNNRLKGVAVGLNSIQKLKD